MEGLTASGLEESQRYYRFEELSDAVFNIFREAAQKELQRGCILELGCGRARLGSALENLGYRVTGIDNNPIACASARTRIAELLELNLTDYPRVSAELAGRQFDWLVAVDVLEHLLNPDAVLDFYQRFLRPDGRVVIAVPNVAVWDNRLRLLFGRFNYADSGVMDRTHVRFFTFKTARSFLLNAGLTPLRTDFDPGIVRVLLPYIKRIIRRNSNPGTMADSQSYRFYMKCIMPVERMFCRIAPGFFGFRIVIEAHRISRVQKPPNH